VVVTPGDHGAREFEHACPQGLGFDDERVGAEAEDGERRLVEVLERQP
jgi:hypothetical protein